MGIRFLCPLCGHRLNVKAFLAGKRGLCPQCGEGLDIPLESQITKSQRSEPSTAKAVSGNGASGNGKHAKQAAVAAEHEAATLPMDTPVATAQIAARQVTIPEPAKSSDRSAPAGSVPLPKEKPTPRTVAPAVSGPAVPTKPPPPKHEPAGPPDPIAEAPELVWYVRPASGGQYGPARGEVMRKWIGEGRVSPDSLVWREGWDDWCTARDVLPGMGTASDAPAPVVAASPKSVVAPVEEAASAAAVYRSRHRNPNSMAIATVSLLGLLCVALVVVLFLVLRS